LKISFERKKEGISILFVWRVKTERTLKPLRQPIKASEGRQGFLDIFLIHFKINNHHQKNIQKFILTLRGLGGGFILP
jgi:hypothetical protein